GPGGVQLGAGGQLGQLHGRWGGAAGGHGDLGRGAGLAEWAVSDRTLAVHRRPTRSGRGRGGGDGGAPDRGAVADARHHLRSAAGGAGGGSRGAHRHPTNLGHVRRCGGGPTRGADHAATVGAATRRGAEGGAEVATAEDVYRIARSLPRTTEGVVRDRVRFRVGRIVYASLSPDETILGVGFPKEEREAAIA